MTREILLIILFAAALVAVCWMLTEYWLGTRSLGMNGEIGRLRFGSRTAFALTHFWKRGQRSSVPGKTMSEGETLL